MSATIRAIQLLGRQFVLGQEYPRGHGEADSARRTMPNLRFSYDMLGEGARTEKPTPSTWPRHAIDHLPDVATEAAADGISIKLSACFALARIRNASACSRCCCRASRGLDRAVGQGQGINLTIDAEEVDRLELSPGRVRGPGSAASPALPAVARLRPGHPGLPDARAARDRGRGGRASAANWACASWCLVKAPTGTARSSAPRKGGLPAYPVFTHKHHTDISYLACAQA